MLKMRKINKIIMHCSATKEGVHFDINNIREWHLKKGFKDVGYHYVILLDGTIQKGREDDKIGAHCTGQNNDSIGISFIGGLDKDGKPKDTRTIQQKAAMYRLICDLRDKYGNIPVYPHYYFSNKACPCFDAYKEYN